MLRGWLPRDMSAPGTAPAVPAEPGPVKISGELHAHVPRIFELWSWAGGKSSELPTDLSAVTAEGRYPQVQNLEIGELAAASGLRLLPAVLAQTEETLAAPPAAAATPGAGESTGDAGGLAGASSGAADPTAGAGGANAAPPSAAVTALHREWPGPSLDSDQNRGYALQWFSFCAIAAVAALFVLYGMIRGGTRRGRQKETP